MKQKLLKSYNFNSLNELIINDSEKNNSEKKLNPVNPVNPENNHEINCYCISCIIPNEVWFQIGKSLYENNNDDYDDIYHNNINNLINTEIKIPLDFIDNKKILLSIKKFIENKKKVDDKIKYSIINYDTMTEIILIKYKSNKNFIKIIISKLITDKINILYYNNSSDILILEELIKDLNNTLNDILSDTLSDYTNNIDSDDLIISSDSDSDSDSDKL
jgi:hypothetical protein